MPKIDVPNIPTLEQFLVFQISQYPLSEDTLRQKPEGHPEDM